MYTNILEYLVHADIFYRLWMVAQLTNPQEQVASRMNTNMVKAREEWHPELVALFDDVRIVPGIVRLHFPQHQLNSEYQFHAGNRKATITTEEMELFWGVSGTDIVETQVIPHPVRRDGPCKIVISNLRMWHHENQLHRRRGDAIIIDQADFYWNTKERTGGLFREDGPYHVTVRGFRAKYDLGVPTHAEYDQLSVAWASGSNQNLGEERVQKVLKKNGISHDYLRAGESVFRDDGESFIFWDEIAREEAA